MSSLALRRVVRRAENLSSIVIMRALERQILICVVNCQIQVIFGKPVINLMSSGMAPTLFYVENLSTEVNTTREKMSQ